MKIVCAGLTVCDLIFRPMGMEVLQRDTSTAEDIRLLGGGDAFNVSVNLANMGEKVSLLTRVGNDDLGEYLLGKLEKLGVDTTWCKKVDIPTSASGVFIRENGERSFLSYKGACHSLIAEDFSEAALQGAEYLYIGSAFDLPELDGEGMSQVFKKAKTMGVKTILDTTGEPEEKDLETFSKVLKYTDYFLPSLREALRLTGESRAQEAAERFVQMGVGCVAIKLGEQGSLLYENGNSYRIPAYAAKLIDTTGAGDAFVAGFIKGLVNGESHNRCAALGNVAGSIAVENVGASGHLFMKEEIERRMKDVTRFEISKGEKK